MERGIEQIEREDGDPKEAMKSVYRYNLSDEI